MINEKKPEKTEKTEKSEVLNILRSMLQVNLGEEIFTFKEFQEFLSSERINYLKISYLPGSNKIILANNQSTKQILEKEVSVTFYKTNRTKSQVDIETFFQDVDMTFSRRATQLICGEIDSSIISRLPKGTNFSFLETFKEKLINFEKKLKNATNYTEENYDIIFSPDEEIEFWKSNRENSNERTKIILKNFSKIEKYFIDSFEINSENVNEVFTSLLGCCEDILQDVSIIPKINPERIKHFLNLSLESLANKANSFISKVNFNDNSANSISKLNEFSKAYRLVCDRIDVMNKIFFGKKPIDININNSSLFTKIFSKVNDLIETKTLLNEMNKLVPQLKLSFEAKSHEEIKYLLNSELDSMSSAAAQRLDEDIFSSGNHVIAQLRELQNWKGILTKPQIQEITFNKRQTLLKDCLDYLQQIKASFDSRQQESIEETVSSNSFNNLGNLSPKMSIIIWVHTLKGKVDMTKKLSQLILKDLADYSSFLNLSDSLISLFNNFINECLNDWQATFMDKKESMLPKVGADLIEINNKTGFINVNFSSTLFLLISDIRVLNEFGYATKIPKDLMKINEEGKKILKEAISLKQIANFYNTLSSQVIPSQKPMLVKNAKDFESSLFLLTERSRLKYTRDSKDLSVNSNQLDLENFVNLVQAAANDLTKEIRKLKKAHSTILDLVSSLLNYDLISHRGKWKEILKKSRNVFNEVAERYKDEPQVLNEWRNHWNYQLYKVLKIQYSRSLKKFFECVTEIDCEFVVSNRTIQTSPPLEELKKSVYKEIKSFVSIPTLIKGFTEDSDCEYYSNLLEINSSQINSLYMNLNNSISKLENLQKNLSETLSLAYTDYETYIQNNFSKLSHWKGNFEQLKRKSREYDKLEDFIKIDIFKVSLRNFKIFSEEMFDRIFDVMSSTLKEKLKEKISSVDHFVKEGMDQMSQKPQTMQEILNFKNMYMQLTRKKFEYKKICGECEEMNKLLFQMSHSQSLNLSSLESRWMNFDIMMNSFSEMIEEQKLNIKKELNQKMSNFNSRIENFSSKWEATKIGDNFIPDKNTDLNAIVISVKNIYDEWTVQENEIQALIDECRNFDIDLPEMPLFNKIKSDINANKRKWENYFNFEKDLDNLHNEDWLSIRHKAFGIVQDMVMNWQDRLKKMDKDFIFFHITEKLEHFKNSLPIYKYLIGDNFERDHWKSLFNLLKFDNKITKENLKFGHFIHSTEILVKKAQDIKDLYSRAQGEILIRNAISELAAWFETAEFAFTLWVNQETLRKTPLIKDWKELMNEISEKSALLISVKSSQYFIRFQEQIEQFENKFANLDLWLTNLNLIQRKWIYLEPIFSRGALPKEGSRFKKIDDEFRSILTSLNTGQRVSTIFSISRIKETLEMLIDQLEKCQKALNDFLEDKRNKFPRLYFLGDDDLLEFLAKSRDNTVIKNNLKKLYQGITYISGEGISISSNQGNKQKIQAILSSLGESVKLSKNVDVTDDLHQWLDELTSSMRLTLSTNLIEGISRFPNYNLSHLDTFPTQICALIEMTQFYLQVQKAIQSNRLQEVKDALVICINNLSIISAKSGSDFIKLFKIKNLMLDLIHNREVLDCLIKNKVSDQSDWYWYSQLKYLIEDTNLKGLMCDAKFDYTYEYQGACPKLVHTPLTDKCYLTLTQALRLGYGGNPYGPAGTGKTESVKALGQALGRQVLVFNCDEGIDFKAMGRIFIGLVKSGAWGCFDEFNRLLEEQLSAISIQIQIIQFSLKNLEPICSLLGHTINVNRHSAIFVTLNPAGKGYGGRSKLPDNLKILFRPVAMSVPDNRQIASTLLTAEGFKYGETLSKKVVALFTSCKSGLSRQIHYDWGLRALKSILSIANAQISLILNKGEKLSEKEEMQILIKAIRINILSKLTFEDAREFKNILIDVFPGVEASDISYDDLNQALEETYHNLHLENIPSQKEKVIQFHEACKGRMGVVLVGPSGCGKSTIWTLLQAAYKKLGQNVVIHIINPKSMPRTLLLGQMNHDTGEYTYGVLTKCAREVEKEPVEHKCWIILDGDVDPEWIEALNSVLDDNRLLTMQNGERINFGQNVNFIFETDSLKFASPATVSRMGIIYMNAEDLHTKSIVNSWIRKHTDDSNREMCTNLFENFFFEIYETLCREYSPMLSTTQYGRINNFLSLLTSDNQSQKTLISKAKFTDALIKGLGANLQTEDRKKFAMYVYSVTNEKPHDLSSSNCLDFYFNEQRDELVPYSQESDIPDSSQNIILTSEVLRNREIVKKWLDKNEAFIIVGPEGCGKSLIIESAVDSRNLVSVFHCTDRTTAANVIQKLLQNCAFTNTGKGRCLRPKNASKLVLYLKDINLPRPDKYNTIGLISFLQQLVTYGGYYDENLDFIQLERIQIISSMNPPSTLGRYEITTRFTGIVRILYIDYPSTQSLVKIYSNFLQAHEHSSTIAEATVGLYSNVKTHFLPDENRHYIFTPRHLTDLILSLSRYENSDSVTEIWAYEACRVFRDRLVDKSHIEKFDKFLSNEILKISSKTREGSKNLKNLNSLSQDIYTSIGGSLNSSGTSLYLNKISREDYIELLNKGKMIYERDNEDLFLATGVEEVYNSMKSVDRAISRSFSNMLLIGTNSMGRKKSLKIVSSALHYEIVSTSLTKDFNFKDFKKALKEVYSLSGLEGRATVWIIEEHHLSAGFMDYINSLLCSGEVPGLFTNEETEAFIEPLHPAYKEQNDFKSIYEFFVSRVRKYLRVAVILDAEGSDFNNILLNNPALVSKCSIIWYQDMCPDSLRELCRVSLAETLEILKKNQKSFDDEKLIKFFIDIHKSVKEASLSLTHSKFIQFILQYKSLVNFKLSNSSLTSSHLQSGLNKLIEAEKFVEELTEKSKLQKLEIEAKSKEANLSLEKIQEAMILSTEKRAHLEKLSKIIEEESVIVEQNKSKVEEELKDVLPEVEKAKNLVKSLDSASLSEIRAYFKMPVLKTEIYLVLKAMLQLIGYSDLSSEGVKSTFNMETISTLKNFDGKKLTPENSKKVMAIVSANPNYFEKSYISRVNYSLAQIAEYVNAIIRFYHAKENIKPLELALEDAESKLNKSKSKLEQNANELSLIDKQIATYKETFAKKTGEAEVLRIDYVKTEEAINKARSLLGKLTGEKIRWQSQIDELITQNESMPYNVMFSSAFITYLGFYNESVRENMTSVWKEILNSKTNMNYVTNMTKFLLTESESLVLKSQGLPIDDLSLQNAVIIQNSLRTNFIIDPVSKATEWFKNHNKSKSGRVFETVSLSDNKLLTAIELSIRFGKTMLITEVDTIEPFLISLIRRDTVKRGPTSVVRLGEKFIDLHENFKLFFSTRDSSIKIPSHIMTSLSLVNFTVTRSGLQALLLGLTIDIEQPELEKKKNESLQDQDRIRLELNEVEKKLLEELINLEGNLLENKTLIASLEESKEKAIKSEVNLKMSVELGQEIDNKRDIYQPLAKLATIIFILLQDLNKINPMYQFSLENFVSVFQKTIRTTSEASQNFEDNNEKILVYSKRLIQNAYQYYSRSLFKSDILVFGLYLIKSITISMEENASIVKENQIFWEFIQGQSMSEISSNIVYPTWLLEERKEIYAQFEKTFASELKNLKLTTDSKWEEWYKSKNPEEMIDTLLPSKKNKSVIVDIKGCLLKLNFIKVFRPDRLESGMRRFICNSLDIKSVNPPSFTLEHLINEIDDNKRPILFVTTLGSDPSRELEDYAEQRVGKEDYIEIPLGAGENDKVVTCIKEASQKGQWLCLKNLHLSISWLGTLEKLLKTLEPHPRFRMFLTSESHPKFSTVLLQSCIKVTYETPPGIKKNMERIFQIWGESLVKEVESQPLISQTLFSLAFIHAVLQERRTYIPQGWSKFYEFSFADLKVSAETCVNYLKHSDSETTWMNIRGLIIESFYGGRIDNEFDYEVMKTYINKIMRKSLLVDKSKSLLGKVPVVFSESMSAYYNAINSLSDFDQPEMFLLPSNVDRSVQRFVSDGVIVKLNQIYSIDSGSVKFEKTSWAEKISPIINLWKSIYSNSDNLDQLCRSLMKVDTKDPVNNFIKSEGTLLVEIVKLIENKISNISSALLSNGLLTSEIMKDCVSMMQNRVPEDWLNLWDGPENPATYIKGVAKKLSGSVNYLKLCLNDKLLSGSINLADLLNPEGFLNSLRQKSARKIKCAIDDMKLVCDFDTKGQDGVHAKITGLFLQGSGFRQGKIVEISGDMTEIIQLPQINIFWELPIYDSIYREKLICKLKLPFEGDYEEMNLKGIAICLDN